MVDTFLLPLGPRLVDARGIGPGMRVLDLTPGWLDDGRRRAEAQALELEWVEADAEDLPFDDASFDVVMSSIGVMFAAQHESPPTSSSGSAARAAPSDC